MYLHGRWVPDSYCAIPVRANVPSRVRFFRDMKFSYIFLGHLIAMMFEKLTYITQNCPFSLQRGFTLFFLRQFFFSNVSGFKSKFSICWSSPPRSVQDRRFKKDLIKVSNYPNLRINIWLQPIQDQSCQESNSLEDLTVGKGHLCSFSPVDFSWPCFVGKAKFCKVMAMTMPIQSIQ